LRTRFGRALAFHSESRLDLSPPGTGKPHPAAELAPNPGASGPQENGFMTIDARSGEMVDGFLSGPMIAP